MEPKAQGAADKKYHRRDGVLVISEERHPALATAGIRRAFREISRDRRQGDGEAELRVLGFGASSPAGRVGAGREEAQQFRGGPILRTHRAFVERLIDFALG
jgi:hypothetical protein